MIDAAWAQAAGGSPAEGLTGLLGTPLPPILLMLGVFYLIVIRPQQQKQKEHRLALANLKKNDEVITNGGLYGRIVALSEDVLTLEIAPNVRVRVSRPQIATVVTAPKPGEKTTNDREKDKNK